VNQNVGNERSARQAPTTMHPLPHRYPVGVAGTMAGPLTVSASGLPGMICDAPSEFGGPGDRWSPESLFVAALASCFILTFRAVARASKIEWARLECSTTGTLERIDGVTRFSRVATLATLSVRSGADTILCERALEKAERECLVANSLRAHRELQIQIVRV